MNDPFPNYKIDLNAVDSQTKPFRSKWIIVGVLTALLATAGAIWAAATQFNDLQRNDLRVEVMWNEVLNQYTRRANLIPNLVSVVKAYAAHESELFTQIAETRKNLANLSSAAQNSRDPQSMAKFQATQNELSVQMSRILVVAQQFPELKSGGLFQDLMAQLEGTENRIAYARQQHIGALADFNLGIRRFPVNLFAERLGLQQRPISSPATEAVDFAPVKIDLKQ